MQVASVAEMCSILASVLILISLALVEYAVLQRHLRWIGIRIHVNGTRGKSTVTRLIAAGLRAGGYRVIAKTTGTLPRLILEDGSEVAIQRRGRATIREHMRAVSLAARRNVDAVVLECMAVHPELQWVAEHRMVRSTIGVITNVRTDHMEVFGSGTDAAAKALCHTVPRRGVLVTTESSYSEIFEERARRQGTRVIRVSTGPDVDAVVPPDPHVFAENYAISLAVCGELGVDRDAALRGMLSMTEDVGALRVYASALNGSPVTFVNAFSVNDTDSLAIVWRKLVTNPLVKRPMLVIFNGREDRPLRSEAFGRAVAQHIRPERLLLVGGAWRFVRREAIRSGYPAERITRLSDRSQEALQSSLERVVQPGSTVVGLGNYAGWGMKIAALFSERARHVR
jgi:poly-gamma-glutamate synthase PgsB/CapB